MSRPRILLVPGFTELEWVIRPRLEEWAEVASYDAPGVGEEPAPEGLSRDAVVRRGLEEVDRRAWTRFFIAADGWAIASAAHLAAARPAAILGMALGHAKLSYRRDGERAPINADVWDAFTQLLDQDLPAAPDERCLRRRHSLLLHGCDRAGGRHLVSGSFRPKVNEASCSAGLGGAKIELEVSDPA